MANNTNSTNTESVELDNVTNGGNGKYFMTGTIRRGKEAGLVEVQIELSEKDITRIQDNLNSDKRDNIKGFQCQRSYGIHILILTLLFTPFAFIIGICTNFYYGTICWYNIYLIYNENESIWKKLLFCPVLVIFYPLIITCHCLVIGFYYTIKQVKLNSEDWNTEMKDIDKGSLPFYCDLLGYPECSPYDLITLAEGSSSPEPDFRSSISTNE
ncbi:unnamed protein product [Dimorphilus gyrociliatus]|uniref:Uncharacterized protein n=1 Tax=Dimorphilus gyrociliatus TaxID=2664684 RepID=A0A7I8VI38_9ANNE|nr:unnamed protein product [Dimorphilus gyrociliatus]